MKIVFFFCMINCHGNADLLCLAVQAAGHYCRIASSVKRANELSVHQCEPSPSLNTHC